VVGILNSAAAFSIAVMSSMTALAGDLVDSPVVGFGGSSFFAMQAVSAASGLDIHTGLQSSVDEAPQSKKPRSERRIFHETSRRSLRQVQKPRDRLARRDIRRRA
jgi:hypothetical protein